MAHSNGKITAPINIETDIYAVLGIGPTANGYDLGYACSNAHGKINIWSRCKPLRWTSMDVNLTNSNWWKGSDDNCGLLPKMVSGYTGIPDAMDGNLNGWEYQPPTGGNVPFRALDFDGYYHNARPPVRSFEVIPTKVENKQGSQFGASAVSFRPPDPNVILDELTLNNFGLSDYYFGIYVKQDNGQQFRRVTSTGSIKSGNISVQVNTYGMPVGTWTVYPFLAQNPIGQDEMDKINQYYTLPNVSPAKVSIVASMVSLMVRSTPMDSMGLITYTITFTNGGYSTLSLTNNYIAFRFPNKDFIDPFVLGESQDKLNDFNVAVGETKTITGTKILSSDLQEKGCKIWVSLKSANYKASTMVMKPLPM